MLVVHEVMGDYKRQMGWMGRESCYKVHLT